ncbi:MAG: ABC transporter ATP-binding protein [Pirellulales bacterium]
MIEFSNVSRSYGAKLAVDDLNLSIPRGELFALLGPNGAGKTTTIKMLVGLLRPAAGSVRVCGYNMLDRPREAHRLLAYVPDEPYLYDKLTGREFLQFIADMFGLEPAVARENISREIETFSLAGFVDELTENYSHGMKQRLAFAAALLHDPQVLVLDEPMVGLDPRSIRLVKDLLRARAAAGMAIFMSTHTLSLAEEIADRIGILDHGRLRFLGTLAELRRLHQAEQTSLEELYLRLTEETPAPAASTSP